MHRGIQAFAVLDLCGQVAAQKALAEVRRNPASVVLQSVLQQRPEASIQCPSERALIRTLKFFGYPIGSAEPVRRCEMLQQRFEEHDRVCISNTSAGRLGDKSQRSEPLQRGRDVGTRDVVVVIKLRGTLPGDFLIRQRSSSPI